MKLSDHQKRVLAALYLLELEKGLRWWSRNEIGRIVGAGGYHQTIQRTTMAILKRAGLVQTERASWPEMVQRFIRCGCACGEWGLTEAGRQAAKCMAIRCPETIAERIRSAFAGWPAAAIHDEDEDLEDLEDGRFDEA